MRDEELIGELRQGRVVPVLDPKTEQGALEMIEALVSGGARVVEITLRTPMARDIFVAARSAFPKIVLGAGSVMDSTLYDEAVRIGILPSAPDAVWCWRLIVQSRKPCI